MTPAELHTAVLAALQPLTPRVTVYDGAVSATPPATSDGQVYPYVVVWPGAGGGSPEASVVGAAGGAWGVQVTVAAGRPLWCLQAIPLVRTALAAELAPGVSLVDLTPPDRPIQRDDDVRPLRWFAPLQFTCLTP